MLYNIMCYNICLYIYMSVTIKIMHLSTLSLTTPVQRQVGIRGDISLYFCQIPHFWGSFSYQILTKAPVIPSNHVRNMICHILSTVKMNACIIRRIYHIMGFIVLNQQTPWVCSCLIFKQKSYRSQTPHYRGRISPSNKVNCPHDPNPSTSRGQWGL